MKKSALSYLVLVFTDVIQITVFIRRIKSGIIILTVYVDDILLTKSDSAGILETRMYLKRHFMTKDMGCPKYIMAIEIAHKKHSALLSKRKNS